MKNAMKRCLSALVFACFAMPAYAVQLIVVVTEIEGNDPFKGIKSVHEFFWSENRSDFRTGTTDLKFPRLDGKGFHVIKLDSVRDSFRAYRNMEGVFMEGSTASGVRVLPGINYQFHFTGNSKRTRVKGCHDGYPSYKIYENGQLVYEFNADPIRVLKLFGSCDIKVDRTYTPAPGGWE